MHHRAGTVIGLALAAMSTVAGCGTSKAFLYPRSDEASARAHRVVDEQRRSLDAEPAVVGPEDREAAERYLAAIKKEMLDSDLDRIMLLLTDRPRSEARRLDSQLATSYSVLESLALFAGRFDVDGRPLDPATAGLLESADVALARHTELLRELDRLR